MLKQRVITALCLAAVLFLILWSRSEWLFGLFLLVFFAAGAWENARLFDNRYPIAVAVLASLIFVFTGLWLSSTAYYWFAFVAVLIWSLCLSRRFSARYRPCIPCRAIFIRLVTCFPFFPVSCACFSCISVLRCFCCRSL